MKKLSTILMLFFSILSFAQSTGSIAGKITDKEYNNEPLPFANVLIKGTTKGTTTDMDGGYEISGLEPGNYTVSISFVGYETLDIPNVVVSAGKTTNVSEALSAGSVSLEGVTITTVAKRESESALLLDQKKAVEIKTSIGAEELSRKGVGNAASAVTKMSGVSKQEGSGSIFVRGLGDRYNVTTLNGLPLPSNNPSKKNIDLGIFSTDIVESIGVSKTFDANNYGDFGGANVDIKAKNFKGKPYVQINLGLVGMNTNVIEKDKFYLQDGPDYFGLKDVARPSNPQDITTYNSWDRVSQKIPFNTSVGVSAGKSFNIGEESKISTFFTGSFGATNNYTEGILRGGVKTSGEARRDYTFEKYTHNTNATLMASVNYRINQNHSILFNSLFLNSAEQKYAEYQGINAEFDGGIHGTDEEEYGFIKRGTFDKTKLFVNQLLGKHTLSERVKGNWALGYSMLDNSIPDRKQNTFVPDGADKTKFKFFSNSAIHNHRFFQELTEDELSGNASVDYNFNKNEEEETFAGTITLGAAGRYKVIDYANKQFYLDKMNLIIGREDIHNVDRYLTKTNQDNGSFRIRDIQNTYDGDQTIGGAFAKAKYNFTDKLTVIAGVRGEYVLQNINYATTLSSGEVESDEMQILPSVMAKYAVTEKQNVKFAASKSYTLPQFKEKVELLYEEVGQGYVGNPDLYASDNYNVDLGWELYPSTGEVVSLTAFGKMILNPINEVFVNSASGDISYANSGDRATLYGAELEVRKDLFKNNEDADFKEKISAGLNVSYMYSNQDLDGDKVTQENVITPMGVNFTYEDSKLTGASDLLANADIAYFKEFSENVNLSATLAYGYFSDKVQAIGTMGRGNLIDKGNHNLDLVVKSQLTKNLNLSFSAKNLLDPTFETVQETQNVIVNAYKKGINIGLSMSYKF